MNRNKDSEDIIKYCGPVWKKDCKRFQVKSLVPQDAKVIKGRRDKGFPRSKYTSPLPLRYRSYIASANRKGVKFQLSLEEYSIVISQSCSYCGSRGGTIDRPNKNDDYTIDTVIPCCSACALMKNMLDQDEFVKRITNIYRHINR